MLQFFTSRRALISGAVLLFLLAASFNPNNFVNHVSAATQPYVSLSGSYTSPGAGSHLVGHHTDQPLTITVALQPRDATQLASLLAELYDPNSSLYHQWLAPREFDARFAPLASQAAQVSSYLAKAGLQVGASETPFLVQATGITTQIETAFRTTLNDYVSANGQSYFQNASAVELPASLSSLVIGVTGLTNTVRMHPHYVTTREAASKTGSATPSYGAGPGGSGLTPSQTASLYDANAVYASGTRGQGATLAVFELSGYTAADITTYEHQFFGQSENIPLVDINVDGGPVAPVCPTGDQCGPFGPPPCANGCNSADYSGDIEVEADIETQIAIAPQIDRVLVYNAPNDFNGTTEVNEYYRIASDDLADSISTSWGGCEQDIGISTIEAESVAFMQLAAQGQSMFSAAGDTGAFDCLRGSGTTGLAVDDPSSQPFVTAVGGTSFGTFDPGTDQHPAYPTSLETVWNVLDQCSASNIAACAAQGAGSGGVSKVWARPSYQSGPGVTSSFGQQSPYCSQARSGQYCREVPDVSANADEFTPYAEYCTGDPKTNSVCATFSSGLTPPGWFGIGGTSLSSPLWSGIIALWDSAQGQRFGNANEGLYELFRSDGSYHNFFHDITGKNQTENNNGFYPTTPDYDMATGIGTPRISRIDKSTP
jgi:subtilase family serine protease